jgi:uncharacterized protein YraI
MACHQDFTQRTLTHTRLLLWPRDSWQRGSNENTVSMRSGPGRADPEGLVPAARGDSREYWPQAGVPSVGPVPRNAGADLT